MQCIKPILLQTKQALRENPLGLLVPCGKCVACRIAYRRMWTIRMTHELHYHEDNIFITLTYDDKHLPVNRSLRKDHLQKFFKRLRRHLEAGKKIKYFACGEYGDNSNRPHYHGIIFGLSLRDEDKTLIIDNWPYCDWSVDSIYKNSFGIAENDSIQYVAGYINKKLSGDDAHNEYTRQGREPVFRIMSQGIGRDYCDEFKDDLTRDKSLMYRGKEMSLPRYYVNRLDIDCDDLKERSIKLDCELNEDTTGVYISSDDLYMSGENDMMRSVMERTAGQQKQRERNIIAKLNLKRSKL